MSSPDDFCGCGNIEFATEAKVIARFVCHCHLCQSYTHGPYNDEVFISLDKVNILHPLQLEFARNYGGRSPLKRSKCKQCGKPVISVLDMTFKKFALVPSDSVPITLASKKIDCHGFYHRRVQDFDDAAPKFNGFLMSQLMTMWFVMIGMMRAKFVD